MEENRFEKLKRYVELTLVVRDLSSPQVRENETAEEYRQTLLRNFKSIGVISAENNTILSESWFPLLEQEAPLTEEETASLRQFGELLLNHATMENIDLPMIHRQASRLLQDARKSGDTGLLIAALDNRFDTSYTMMYLTQRLHAVCNLMYRYRDEAIACAEEAISYLPPERFATLSDASKNTVLVLSRYIATAFEREDAVGDSSVNKHDLDILDRSLALASDPFYKTQAPDSYDWLNHRFRTLQYISAQVERGNPKRLDADLLARVNTASKEMKRLWLQEYETLHTACTEELMELYVVRAAYYAGELDADVYRNALLDIVSRCDESDYSFRSAKVQLMAPLEYMHLLDSGNLTSHEISGLRSLYRHMIGYVHRMPKKGSMSFMLTFVTDLIDAFVDMPDGLDFETFCLGLIASLHPPTYVHSLTVADLSASLTGHLLRLEPARFTGMFGTQTAEDVLARADDIKSFAYHAALCHDFGKLYVAEIIMTYGRNLFDEEFEMVKLHPEIGAHVLSKHISTAPYANIALLHHKWFNDQTGYPQQVNKNDLRERTVIDIVACADCMDAATDVVGRSYKFGKSFDEFLTELEEGAGTRYAPYLNGLLHRADVRADVERILSEERNENYRRAYRILKNA